MPFIWHDAKAKGARGRTTPFSIGTNSRPFIVNLSKFSTKVDLRFAGWWSKKSVHSCVR